MIKLSSGLLFIVCCGRWPCWSWCSGRSSSISCPSGSQNRREGVELLARDPVPAGSLAADPAPAPKSREASPALRSGRSAAALLAAPLLVRQRPGLRCMAFLRPNPSSTSSPSRPSSPSTPLAVLRPRRFDNGDLLLAASRSWAFTASGLRRPPPPGHRGASTPRRLQLLPSR